MRIPILFVFFIIAATFLACKKEDAITPVESFGFVKPAHFPQPNYTFEQNTQTLERFELGRALFYDPILSLDSTISCANCHDQAHGFADHNVKFSNGVNGAVGERNSPALSNLAWYPNFMWDGGVNHIETFSVAPITNVLEMKETIAHVITKLNNNTSYKAKFKQAYGSETITDQYMLKALGQFLAMTISSDSKYDRVYQGVATFSSNEQNGYTLFKAHCTSCHAEPLTTDFSFRNNGLDVSFTDLGRNHITLDPNDLGKFRVPNLRNIELTYPYMHDGRFFTLTQVIEHYSTGIKQSATLDPTLSTGFNFTTQEKLDLITFLKTLTDNTFLAKKILSAP